MKRPILLALFAVLGVPLAAFAGGAKEIVLDDFASFAQGKLEGVVLRGSGELAVGERFERLAVDDASTAFSLARDARGRTFVGTAPAGVVYALEGDRLVRFGETGALLVASLAFGPDGTLYAGTLPEGKIFALDASGAAREFVALEGAEHVWGLAFHAASRSLIAATGPEGKLFSIDTAGTARVLLDAEETHLLSLALDVDGSILVGTDGPALLYRVDARGTSRVAFEFPGNEVRALAVAEDGIYVAANEMPAPPPAPAKADGPAPLKAKLEGAKPGKGRLYRLSRDGSVERLLARTDGHFTGLSRDQAGHLLIAQAGGGRLFRLEARDRVGIAADLDDAQLLAIDATQAPLLVATGNGAALHRGGSAGEPAYVSKVFDTGPGSRLGRLSFRGEGAIRVQSRTGPRAEPDGSWSDWSTPISTPGPLRSRADRFVQLKVLLPARGDAALRSLSLGYLPENRRARVSNVRATVDEKSTTPSPELKLEWNVDTADGDELRYRLTFREESQTLARPMFLEDVILTKNEYVWDTSGVPDGYYIVTVEASDERANAPERTTTHSEESEPLRVDNHPPVFASMRVERDRLRGRVTDAIGPISRLELSVDGGPFVDQLPTDGILDGPTEDFDLDLSALPRGEHILTLRVTDASRNSARRELIAAVGR